MQDWLIYIILFIIGALIFYILKDVCGCKKVEGNNHKDVPDSNIDIGTAECSKSGDSNCCFKGKPSIEMKDNCKNNPANKDQCCCQEYSYYKPEVGKPVCLPPPPLSLKANSGGVRCCAKWKDGDLTAGIIHNPRCKEKKPFKSYYGAECNCWMGIVPEGESGKCCEGYKLYKPDIGKWVCVEN
jgi:hypothetical protein